MIIFSFCIVSEIKKISQDVLQFFHKQPLFQSDYSKIVENTEKSILVQPNRILVSIYETGRL